MVGHQRAPGSGALAVSHPFVFMNGHDRRGFTLIELLIVVVIVAILAAIAWGRFNRPRLTVVAAPDSVVAPQAAGRFVVQVQNSFGRPQRGVPVVFRVVEGNATITPEVVQTDSTGSASAQWVAGTEGGLNAFSARVGDSDWSGAQTTVSIRVDPASGGPAQPSAPAIQADSAARRDTAVPPTDSIRRDTGGVAPPAAGEPVHDRADTASARIPWSTRPVWARNLPREIPVLGEQ